MFYEREHKQNDRQKEITTLYISIIIYITRADSNL